MHPDLPYEQAYFDRALALRDRQQADLALAPSMAANPRAAVELRKRVSRLGLADPDEAIAFGRIEAHDDRWYIGKGAIWDDDNDLVVVNWQAPIAAPFYTATPEDPEGLDARRLYRCSGNQIREIEDLMFREVADAIVSGRPPGPVLSDALLESLGAARAGELGDIVTTIQAAQYEVISHPLDQLLVVQGGPGTGKTVVGLHRVSWLLFNRRNRLDARDVLVVGPNPAFVGYISSVLPSLGDEAVVQLPMQALGPRVRIGRVDPPELRRLKGDRRMLRLILRGLRNRQRVEAVPVHLTVDGQAVELDGRRIATRARQLAGRPHNEGYRMLRAFLVAEATAALTRGPLPAVPTLRGEAARDIDNYLDRVWPSLTPQTLFVELCSSRRQLLAAGAGTLSETELDMLALPTGTQVTSWSWSVDDVPILDAADALLNGVGATYEHIVVDEAQDLSPLQLESIRRRSRAGSMTVLGDLAQGTAPWAHSSWDPIVQALRHERVTAETVELDYGYRLPAEVHEVATRLLPEVAPGMACPQALRSSGHEIAAVSAAPADLAGAVVDAVRDLAADGIVGVITPASARATVVAALDAAGVAWSSELRPSAAPVVLLVPDEAKGLEFDSVVVAEPAAIVTETDHGLRSLFVALTRCTNRLTLVHTQPLPAVLGLGADDDSGARAQEEAPVPDPERAEAADDAGEPSGAMPVPFPEVHVDDAEVGVPSAVASPSAVADPPAVASPPAEPGPDDAADLLDTPEVVDATGRPGALADRVVVSTPAPAVDAVDAALAALDDIDHDIARAVAGAIVDKLVRAVGPSLLPLVAEEIARALAVRAGRADQRPPAPANGSGHPVPDDAETSTA
jgi:DNA helicase IV